MRRPILLGAALAALALTAVVPAATAKTPTADGARMTVDVQVKRIDARRARTVAQGTVTATLTDLSGNTTRIRQPVRLSQIRAGSCRILQLVLDELDLTLLGLNVHLDKVDLRITGNARGGVLGRLFCRLAKSTSASARDAAADSINARLRKRPLRMVGFTVPISPKTTTAQAQPPRCQVLNLVLGPLDLDLLGLIVQLNKVKLDITAIRGGGVLGDLFCDLSGPNQQPQQ